MIKPTERDVQVLLEMLGDNGLERLAKYRAEIATQERVATLKELAAAMDLSDWSFDAIVAAACRAEIERTLREQHFAECQELATRVRNEVRADLIASHAGDTGESVWDKSWRASTSQETIAIINEALAAAKLAGRAERDAEIVRHWPLGEGLCLTVTGHSKNGKPILVIHALPDLVTVDPLLAGEDADPKLYEAVQNGPQVQIGFSSRQAMDGVIRQLEALRDDPATVFAIERGDVGSDAHG